MGKIKENKENAPPGQAAALAQAKSEALLDQEAKESPILSLIAKRLRTARKKVKRAEEIEAIRDTGKPINGDQEETIRLKAKNQATVEELERLFPLLKEASGQEIKEKLAEKTTAIELKAKEGAAIELAEQLKQMSDSHQVEKTAADKLVEELTLRAESAVADLKTFEERHAEEKTQSDAKYNELSVSSKTATETAVARILKLFYFSRLFSTEGFANEYVPTTERGACLSYDATLQPTDQALSEEDLDSICEFGKKISSRPLGKVVSHEAALKECTALALDWVHGQDSTLPGTTVSDLVSKFERILQSEYTRIKPREIVPDLKPVPNQAAAYQPEIPAGARSSGLTISGHAAPFQTDLPPVRSGGLNGHYNPPPHNPPQQFQGASGHQGQNAGPLLHHLMGQPRQSQGLHERQLPAEAIGFIPQYNQPSSVGPNHNAGHSSQTAHSAHNATSHNNGGPTPVPVSSHNQASYSHNQQPPGFEVGEQKQPSEVSKPPAASFNAHPPSFQGGGPFFGGISSEEVIQPSLNLNAHQPSYTPLHDASPNIDTQPPASKPTTTETGVGTVQAPASIPASENTGGVRVEYTEPVSAEPRSQVTGAHQSRGPQEPYRGRGPSRGRGGRDGGYAPRGGPRRGGYNQGRGRGGGRGRDYGGQHGNPNFAPQHVNQAAAY